MHRHTVINWCNFKMPLRLSTLLTQSFFYLLLNVFNLGRCYNSFYRFIFVLVASFKIRNVTVNFFLNIKIEPLWPKSTKFVFYILSMQMHSIKMGTNDAYWLIVISQQLKTPSTFQVEHRLRLCYDLINIYSYLSLLRFISLPYFFIKYECTCQLLLFSFFLHHHLCSHVQCNVKVNSIVQFQRL